MAVLGGSGTDDVETHREIAQKLESTGSARSSDCAPPTDGVYRLR